MTMQDEIVLSNLKNQWVNYIGFVIFNIFVKILKNLTDNYKCIGKWKIVKTNICLVFVCFVDSS